MARVPYRSVREFGEEIEGGTAWPRPICPVCENGYLSGSVPVRDENALSRSLHSHEAWEAEWINGTWVARFECESSTCRQVVTAVGTYRVSHASLDASDAPNSSGPPDFYTEFYRVEYFSPPLPLLNLPEDAPEEVREAVDRAARLLFAAPGLAGTALRASVERFLTAQGIAATDDRGHFLPLDARIAKWRKSTCSDRAAEMFLAVKWIGNEGTHEVGGLSVADVLDGVDFIDEAFHDLFVAPDLDARAKAVNSARGRAAWKRTTS